MPSAQILKGSNPRIKIKNIITFVNILSHLIYKIPQIAQMIDEELKFNILTNHCLQKK